MKTNEEKETIKIVHYKEAEALLRFVVKFEKYEGEINCHICKTKVTVKSFKALTRKSGKILFCCDNPKCYVSFIKFLKE